VRVSWGLLTVLDKLWADYRRLLTDSPKSWTEI